MLTVDFDRLGIGPGSKVIDVGCGAGRHSFEAYRRGADVVAFDQNAAELGEVDTLFRAMADAGEAPPSAHAETVVGDARDCRIPTERSTASSRRRFSSTSRPTTLSSPS